ncbi:MAG: chemotaxis protein CheW [Oligoflexales bacterium]
MDDFTDFSKITESAEPTSAAAPAPEEYLGTFIQELNEIVQNLESSLIDLETQASDGKIINQTFRLFHNLKGSSASMGFDVLKDLAHFSESLLDLARSGKMTIESRHVDLFLEALSAIKITAEKISTTGKQGTDRYFDVLHKLVLAEKETRDSLDSNKGPNTSKEAESAGSAEKKNTDLDQIKVSRSVIEQMMLLVGEFMQIKNKINWLRSRYKDREYYDNCHELEQFSGKLQRNILKLRLSPVKPIFHSMRRVVRSTAQQVDKKINFEIGGEDTLLDRSILDVLSDPLMHILRNAIDHGIEKDTDRVTSNKPEVGNVILKASYRTGEVHISVTDDGRGIDPARVKAKAVKLGIISESQAHAMTPQEAYQLVFLPGFSGAEQITETSGRGVGMDVVKERVTSIGGQVDIQTEVGAGTSFTLRLPLSLAIVECLGFRVGSQTYAIPQMNVEEVFSLTSPIVQSNVRLLENGNKVLVVRDSVAPILDLPKILEEKSKTQPEALIKVRHGKFRFILEVDHILGPMSIVSQPLPRTFSKRAPFSGITKQGDGSLLFQLDVVKLFSYVESTSTRVSRKSDHNRGAVGTDQEGALLTSSEVRRIQQKTIAFRNNLNFCLPVQRAKRIVFITKEDISEIGEGGRSFITLDGKTIPLIWIEETLLRQKRIRRDNYSLLIVQNENETFGVPMVEFKGIERMPEVYDTSIAESGILGSTVIGKDTYLAVDIPGMIRMFQGKEVVRKHSRTQNEARPITILCAEDDKFFASELTSTLRAAGYNLVMCEDGLIAKNKLEDPAFVSTIDAIVADIEMPNLTGLALCRWLKGTKHAAHLPVIAYTAITTEEMREKMMSAGAHAFISKMALDDLSKTIHKVLKGDKIDNTKPEVVKVAKIDRMVTFQLGTQWYALPMENIKEVSPKSPSADIPGADPWMRKVTAFRGSMVPVLDLTKYIGGDQAVKTLEQAILEVDSYTLALRVNKIGEVVIKSQLTVGDGLPKVSQAESMFTELVSQVATYQNQILFILSPSKLASFCVRTEDEGKKREMVA